LPIQIFVGCNPYFHLISGWPDNLTPQNYYCLSSDKGTPFTLDYDKLIISVGSYSNTFGIPGVKEHGFFLKDIQDARKIRARILECK
jgi:hypothetical protein